LRREEAMSILEELLDNFVGLDGHYVEFAPPNPPISTMHGYQIGIKGALEREIKKTRI
jgi:hypothetical protein